MSTPSSSAPPPAKRLAWLSELLDKRAALALWLIYALTLLSKGALIPYLGAASFPSSDEHIFIELAKSFFYQHNFYSGGISFYMPYNEILLPLVLSPAYFFFSPDHILDVLRFYGLALISLAVFPAYLLGLRVLGSKPLALLIAVLAVLLPEITLAYTVSQEVLYYPLYLLALWQIYRRIQGERVSPFGLAGLLLLLWLCKAVGLTVFLAYLAYLAWEFVFVRKFRLERAFVIELAVLLVGVVGIKQLVTLGVQALIPPDAALAGDFYAKAVSGSLRAAPALLLRDIPAGTLHYLFYTACAFLGLPLLLPLDYIKHYLPAERAFLRFLWICLGVTLATVVLLIYMAEGGAYKEVQRVHLRYLFPLFVPFTVLLFRIDFARFRFGFAGGLGWAFLLLYGVLLHPRFKSGSTIDAKSLLLLERINNGPLSDFNLWLFAGGLALVGALWLLARRWQAAAPRRVLFVGMAAILLLNQVYAAHKTYSYYTTSTSGLERRREYAQIGQAVASRPGLPLLLYEFPSAWFDVLVSTQTDRDFVRANYTPGVLTYPLPAGLSISYVLTPKDLLRAARIRGASQLDMGLTMFDVYQMERPAQDAIQLEYAITGIYPDGWLKEGARLYIAGAGRGDQVEVELTLKTGGQASTVDALIRDTSGALSTVRVSPAGTPLKLLVRKLAGEQDFILTLDASAYFVPREMPEVFGPNDDGRRLSYSVEQVRLP